MLVGPAFVPAIAPGIGEAHQLKAAQAKPVKSQAFEQTRVATFCAAVAAVAVSRRATQRKAKAKESAESDEPQNFWQVTRRTALSFPAVGTACGAAAARAAPALEGYATLDMKVDDTGCAECESSGLVACAMCEGTGQFRTWGTDSERMPVKQFVTCPECNGVGERVCQKCAGTGLPAKHPLACGRETRPAHL